MSEGQPGSPSLSAAAHLGGASIALGSVFLIMAPPTFMLVYILSLSPLTGWNQFAKGLVAIGGYATVFLILLFALVGAVLGFRAMAAACRAGLPDALGLAGVLLNGLAVMVWLGAGVAWYDQAHRLL